MTDYKSIWNKLKEYTMSKRDMYEKGTPISSLSEDTWGMVFYADIVKTMNSLETESKNTRVSPTELENLPFGTNIVVHIITDDRDETYNGVIVGSKIYYEDGKIDECHLIAEYVYNNAAEVFVK